MTRNEGLTPCHCPKKEVISETVLSQDASLPSDHLIPFFTFSSSPSFDGSKILPFHRLFRTITSTSVSYKICELSVLRE
jgi:hypothetical protein